MLEEGLLNELQEGILLVDKKSNVLFANTFFLNQLHYVEGLQDRKFEELIEDKSQIKSLLNKQEKVKFNFRDAHHHQVRAWGKIALGEYKGETVFWIIVTEWSNDNYTKKELEQLLDIVPYSLWLENFKGNYRYVNKALVEEVSRVEGRDFSKEEIYELKGYEVWNKSVTREHWDENNELLEEQGLINQIKWSSLGNEPYCHALSKLAVTDHTGKIKAVYGFKSYRTEIRNIEEELYKAYIQNMDMHDRLKPLERNSNQEQEKSEIPYYMGALDIFIYEYNEAKKQVELKCCIGENKGVIEKNSPIPMKKEDYIQCAKSRKVWTIEDFIHTFKWPGTKEEVPSIHYVTIYPIYYDNETYGLLVAGYSNKSTVYMHNAHIMDKIGGYLGGLIRNFNYYQRAYNELATTKELEENLMEFFNIPPLLYSVYNYDTAHITMHFGWQQLLGWQEEDVMGLKGMCAIHEEYRDEFYECIQQIKSGKSIAAHITRMYCKNGDIKYVKWWGKRVGTSKTLTMVGIDVTEEMHSLERIAEYRKVLELQGMKTQFMNKISHELKTPLNMIYCIEQLNQKDIDRYLQQGKIEMGEEPMLRYQKTLRKNIYRLLRLTNNIVDITELSVGSYYLNLKSHNIVEVIENITMTVIDYIKSNTINIIFDTAEEEIEMVCDSDKIETIILNLLSNAVKYSKEKGNILVRIARQRNHAVIEVTDDGIGIPEDKIEGIFECFTQVDQSLTRKCEGSGVGLTLVKALVDIMEGDIKVKSKIGKGTTFTIKLPIRKGKCTATSKRELGQIGRSNQMEKCSIEFSDIYSF